MTNMIEATNETSEFTAEDFQAETSDSQNENSLSDEIASLWSDHIDAKKAARATTAELRALRAKLGAQLSEMKQYDL